MTHEIEATHPEPDEMTAEAEILETEAVIDAGDGGEEPEAIGEVDETEADESLEMEARAEVEDMPKPEEAAHPDGRADADGTAEDGAEDWDGEEGEEPSAPAEMDAAPDEGHIRMLEALLFASAEPLAGEDLAQKLPEETAVEPILKVLQARYAERGVVLVEIAGRWAFRTAPDLAFLLEEHAAEEKRLSRAALETLAIVAYHQPVTRAEIEEIRGVSVSKGTLDQLLEIGWVQMRGRRRTPGRPVTYGTSDEFLEQFSLAAVSDLPGLEDLKAAGLLGSDLPPGFVVPDPAAALAQADDGEEGEDTEGQGDLGYRPELVEDTGSAEDGAAPREPGPANDVAGPVADAESEEMAELDDEVEEIEPPRLAAGE